jgi:hypothetical protein
MRRSFLNFELINWETKQERASLSGMKTKVIEDEEEDDKNGEVNYESAICHCSM